MRKLSSMYIVLIAMVMSGIILFFLWIGFSQKEVLNSLPVHHIEGTIEDKTIISSRNNVYSIVVDEQVFSLPHDIWTQLDKKDRVSIDYQIRNNSISDYRNVIKIDKISSQ